MREGWDSIKLADAVEILNGFAFKSSRYVPEGIRVIRISNVQKGYVEDKDPKFYPASSKDEIKKYLLQEGDLLMSLTGNVGRVGLLPGSMLPCALNQRVACLRVKSAKLSKMFLFYLLNSNVFEAMCIKFSSGVAQLNMSTEWLKEQVIPLPSLPEQQRIVDILDQEFAKIDALKANAEKSLQAAKDLYAECLNSSLSFKDGWKTKTLDEVCSKITDGTHNSPPNTAQGEFKYITAKNIKPWGLDLTDISFVSADTHRDIFSRCNPCKGDVLYIKDGATTGIAILNPLEEEFSLLSSVALLKPLNTEITSKYLCYAMNSPKMYAFVRGKMDGAAITRITLKKIKEFPISFPPLEEQDIITACLDKLNEKCSALQENYKKTLALCDDLKQSLLRKAFNGEL